LSDKDPLLNGIIDLESDRFGFINKYHSLLVGKKASTKNLSNKRSMSEFAADKNKIRQQYRFILMPSEV